MEKNQSNLKIVIVLLVVIILLLIGLSIFFIEEFIDEKEEIKNLYNNDDRVYTDNSSNVTNNDNSNDNTNSNENNNKNYISRENALKIALDDAKINQSDIRDIDIELDYKYGQTVYEVNFDYQQYEYEYYINAESGNIVKSFKEID